MIRKWPVAARRQWIVKQMLIENRKEIRGLSRFSSHAGQLASGQKQLRVTAAVVLFDLDMQIYRPGRDFALFLAGSRDRASPVCASGHAWLRLQGIDVHNVRFFCMDAVGRISDHLSPVVLPVRAGYMGCRYSLCQVGDQRSRQWICSKPPVCSLREAYRLRQGRSRSGMWRLKVRARLMARVGTWALCQTPAAFHEMRLHVTVHTPAEPGWGRASCRRELDAPGCCSPLRVSQKVNVAIRARNKNRPRLCGGQADAADRVCVRALCPHRGAAHDGG